jgi:hypothetical protein
VYEAHYIQLRPKEEIRALVVEEAGITMPEEEFEEVTQGGFRDAMGREAANVICDTVVRSNVKRDSQ